MNATANRCALGGFGERLSGLFQRKPLVIVPPTLSEPKRFPYGQFQMQVTASVQQEYAIEVTTDLRNWAPVFSGVAEKPSIEFLDPSAANYSYRFYRARTGNLVSPNVVGYATITIAPGFSMIANPFQRADNSFESVFPKVPEGTTLTKFDTFFFKLRKNRFSRGSWSNPAEKLAPGEGAIIFNPTQDYKTLLLTGEVLQGELSVPIPAGFSIRSAIVPVPGQLDADLLFPVADEDAVHMFDRDRQQYVAYAFQSGKWSPEPPILGVGESFWVGKAQAGNWSRTVLLNQVEDAPLAFA